MNRDDYGGNGAPVSTASKPDLETALVRPRYTVKEDDMLRFERLYSRAGANPLDDIEYEKGPVNYVRGENDIFHLEQAEFPKYMSQNARDIAAGLYFRKAGVPETGTETSFRQVVHRLGVHFRQFGEQHGDFRSKDEADAFQAEYTALLGRQMLAPNSPVWFNFGLNPVYGLSEKKNGMFYWDFENQKVVPSEDSLARPQGPACFITKVEDDLIGQRGIFDTMTTEARLFKYGSGNGSNWSSIREAGAPLSGGGVASGLKSFLKMLDVAAGSVKSGGTTRRAAKMVVVDIDHPEIEAYIDWKLESERQVAALAAAGYNIDYRASDSAYKIVSGQNSNNSVRVPDRFMQAVVNDDNWDLVSRVGGRVVKTVKARDLWDRICKANIGSGDPGIQFGDTINNWNPVLPLGEIKASNPCSEYLFLDDTACNLASINLIKFVKDADDRYSHSELLRIRNIPEYSYLSEQELQKTENPNLELMLRATRVPIHPTNPNVFFDLGGFIHTIRTSIMQQEILVDLSSYPGESIAQNSHDLRPLGLGYTNMGALLMHAGMPYDSDMGRTLAASITAIMTGEAYAQSARIAARLGPFPRWEETKDRFMEVINQHRDFAYKIQKFENLEGIIGAAHSAWERAVELGNKNGYRNAQTTVIAPTGTIGPMMDSDTTGIEPEFAFIKIKKLSGGGNMKFVNNSVGAALRNLGYSGKEVEDIVYYMKGHGKIDGRLKEEVLELGFSGDDMEKANKVLQKSLDFNDKIESPITPQTLLKRGADGNLVSRVFHYVNGEQTIEGAPHLKDEHYAIFDCANKSGKGKRYIHVNGHIDMLGNRGIGPFLSGGASKTVNLPSDATIEDVSEAYMRAWREWAKVVALFPDGSKLSQPLNAAEKRESRPLLEWGAKKELPFMREGFTLEVLVGDSSASFQPVFIRTGEYEDGTLGEVFIDMYREGSPFKAKLSSWAVQTSKSLKLGMPLTNLIGTYLYVDAKPNGQVKNYPYLIEVPSIESLVVRVLGLEYLGVDKFKEQFGEEVKGIDFRRIDPTKLRVAKNKELNRFQKYMKIVRGEHLKEATRDARGRKKKKEHQFQVPTLNGNGPTNLGGNCVKCGGFMKPGKCPTCSSCGHSEGCG